MNKFKLCCILIHVLLLIIGKIDCRKCSELQIGQYKCEKAPIDEIKQTEVNCSVKNTVQITCYPAKRVKCDNKTFDGITPGFYIEQPCRYVTSYKYQTAVLLSIFLGIFGADRFYLGYMAMGVIKMCTFGLMFIGYFIDMLLIITQTLIPIDGSNYIVDYYGQVLYPSAPYNNNTFNYSFN